MSSCFCTPDGRVIHAVSGPVSGSKLREEAKWAVALYQELDKLESPMDQALLVQAAHSEKHRAQSAALRDMASFARSGRTYTMAHEVLSAHPLAHIQDIGPLVFNKLTGETFRQNRSLVYKAAEGFELAKKTRRPMVLIFFKGTGHNQDMPQPDAQAIINVATSDPGKATLPAPVVIAVPMRELAALSQLTDLPPYELSSAGPVRTVSPTIAMVIADPDGKQLAAKSAGFGQSLDLATLNERLFEARKTAKEEAKTRRREHRLAKELAKE